MYGSSTVTPKVKIEVEVALTDGTVMTGSMFLLASQRVLDIVNDDRRFVPFAASDGPTSVINKEVIARITEIEGQVDEDAKVVAFR